MTNELTISTDDGWADAAAEASERTLRGALVKFADRCYTKGKENVPLKVGTELIALAIAAAWVRWEGGKPVENRLRQPGARMPERGELPDGDKSKWPVGLAGEAKDPWENTRFVYLVDPTTAEAFTFVTSSWGGRTAAIDLSDAVGRMRMARPDALPLVSLEVAPWKTKYGMKSRPNFKIVGWRTAEGQDIEQPKSLAAKTVAQPRERTDLDDSIPF